MNSVIIFICAFAVLLTLLMLASCIYKIDETVKAKKTIHKIKEREAEKAR